MFEEILPKIVLIIIVAVFIAMLLGLAWLAKNKRKIFFIIISVCVILVAAYFARRKFMNYYKFVDKECKVHISDNLVFIKGAVSLNKKHYTLLFEVKVDCEEKLNDLLDKNLSIGVVGEKRWFKQKDKTYGYVYNDGNIKQRYCLAIPDKGKGAICVNYFLIEKNNKLYLYVVTW